MTYRRSNDDLRNPERVFSQMIKDYVDGKLNFNRVFYRAQVIKIDWTGGLLEANPPNPPGSIRARVYTYGLDANIPTEALTIFYPFYSISQMPSIAAGEHVYVVFEDQGYSSGLWVAKVPQYADINYGNPDFITTSQSNQPSSDIFEGTQRNSNSQVQNQYVSLNNRTRDNQRMIQNFESPTTGSR